jgi:mono/diheme cytochrome c family protein
MARLSVRREVDRRAARDAARGTRVERPGTTLRRALASLVILAGAVSLTACRQDMHQAPRYDPLERSPLFADQRSARALVEGTVARGQLRDDKVFYTGKQPDGQLVGTVPVPVDRALLLRGQDRYNVYCSPCHGRTGDGNGMVVQRGFKAPASYHTDRLREQPVGYFYDVITNGFGAMQDYSAQVAPRDRWAIAAYIRTLQFSRHATVADVPAERRGTLEAAAAAPEAAHGSGASTHD